MEQRSRPPQQQQPGYAMAQGPPPQHAGQRAAVGPGYAPAGMYATNMYGMSHPQQQQQQQPVWGYAVPMNGNNGGLLATPRPQAGMHGYYHQPGNPGMYGMMRGTSNRMQNAGGAAMPSPLNATAPAFTPSTVQPMQPQRSGALLPSPATQPLTMMGYARAVPAYPQFQQPGVPLMQQQQHQAGHESGMGPPRRGSGHEMTYQHGSTTFRVKHRRRDGKPRRGSKDGNRAEKEEKKKKSAPLMREDDKQRMEDVLRRQGYATRVTTHTVMPEGSEGGDVESSAAIGNTSLPPPRFQDDGAGKERSPRSGQKVAFAETLEDVDAQENDRRSRVIVSTSTTVARGTGLPGVGRHAPPADAADNQAGKVTKAAPPTSPRSLGPRSPRSPRTRVAFAVPTSSAPPASAAVAAGPAPAQTSAASAAAVLVRPAPPSIPISDDAPLAPPPPFQHPDNELREPPRDVEMDSAVIPFASLLTTSSEYSAESLNHTLPKSAVSKETQALVAQAADDMTSMRPSGGGAAAADRRSISGGASAGNTDSTSIVPSLTLPDRQAGAGAEEQAEAEAEDAPTKRPRAPSSPRKTPASPRRSPSQKSVTPSKPAAARSSSACRSPRTTRSRPASPSSRPASPRKPSSRPASPKRSPRASSRDPSPRRSPRSPLISPRARQLNFMAPTASSNAKTRDKAVTASTSLTSLPIPVSPRASAKNLAVASGLNQRPPRAT